jgi:hypothetical protein
VVPIYYMQQENIQLGDRVRVSNQSFERTWLSSLLSGMLK